MSRQDPGAATGQQPRVVVPVDWSHYRKCDVCGAGLGAPCLLLSGRTGSGAAVAVPADWPHGGRPMRSGAVDRG